MSLEREPRRGDRLGVFGRGKEDDSGRTRVRRGWLGELPSAGSPHGSVATSSPGSYLPYHEAANHFSNDQSDLFALTLGFRFLRQEYDGILLGFNHPISCLERSSMHGGSRAERRLM